MRPDIKILRKFAKRYFRKPVHISYRRMKDGLCGRAFLDKRLIYLNSNIPLASMKRGFGVGIRERVEVKIKYKLKEGEQYFLTLLHEIYHYKVKFRPSKKWVEIRRKLRKEYPKNPDLQCYACQDYLNRNKNESFLEFQGRISLFQSWLVGDTITEHMRVEKEAIKEFGRRRKEISKILAECSKK